MKTLDKNLVCLNCGRKFEANLEVDVDCPKCHSLDIAEVPFQKVSLETYPECWNCGFKHKDLVSCPSCHAAVEGMHPSDTSLVPTVPSALTEQIGGTHYKDLVVQPVEFCQKNKLNHCESSIIKYASRHKHKNGAEDVKKIIHYAKLLLEIDYGVRYEDD